RTCVSTASSFAPTSPVSLREALPSSALRTEPPSGAQGGGLPDPRQPRGRAEEVRQGEGPPVLPVLQALISRPVRGRLQDMGRVQDRKSTRLNSSHVKSSYAVFCLKQT